MNKLSTSPRFTVLAASMLLASVALVGCNRSDPDVARTGSTPAVTSSTAPVVVDRSDANRSTDAAKANADNAVANAQNSARNAGDAAGGKVSDAVITTSVNAELVKDPSLSALRIDVDTSSGRVALKGAAPNKAARDRATQLASAVKGVVSVDNQLRVDEKM